MSTNLRQEGSCQGRVAQAVQIQVGNGDGLKLLEVFNVCCKDTISKVASTLIQDSQEGRPERRTFPGAP